MPDQAVRISGQAILELFPPGRCRRIFKHLVEHREEIDDLRHCGELTFHLGTRGSEGVVSTAGPHWKPENIEL